MDTVQNTGRGEAAAKAAGTVAAFALIGTVAVKAKRAISTRRANRKDRNQTAEVSE